MEVVELKIVILDGYTVNPGDLSWIELEKKGQLLVYDRTPENQVAQRIGDAEIVFTNKAVISRESIFKCPNIKFIGVLATGYNIVDVAAAKEKGIPVCNIPTYGTYAVAQHAIALLLEICHHIGAHSESVKAGDWIKSSDWCYWNYPLIELKDKNLGIIGLGRIGSQTAKIAQALGMKVLAVANTKKSEPVSDMLKYVTLDEVFELSDVIALHCPLTPSTKGIICADSISKMKDGVIIINNSRGSLIVEQDLADALNSGKVAAAGLDVLEEEPMSPNCPLLTAKNCIITPHISWAAKEPRIRIIEMALHNLEMFLKGTPVNIVN